VDLIQSLEDAEEFLVEYMGKRLMYDCKDRTLLTMLEIQKCDLSDLLQKYFNFAFIDGVIF
jgi:hypothetical protein